MFASEYHLRQQNHQRRKLVTRSAISELAVATQQCSCIASEGCPCKHNEACAYRTHKLSQPAWRRGAYECLCEQRCECVCVGWENVDLHEDDRGSEDPDVAGSLDEGSNGDRIEVQ
jgi:hypothetical protein